MIISSYCPSGKVGKTTTSLALAKTAQSKGLNTCVLEFDFSPGDIAALLRLDPSRNILDLASGQFEIAIQKPENEEFKVVLAGDPDYANQLTGEIVENILEELEEYFDLVIVDIQPNFIESCVNILQMSHHVLLILNNDFQIVSRATRNIEWGIKSGYFSKEKMQILINKADKKQKDDFILNSQLQEQNSELYLPVLNSVPMLKNFQGYSDDRFLKFIDNTFGVLFPQYSNLSNSTEKKEGFFSKLFKNKKQANTHKQEVNHLSLPAALPKAKANSNNLGEDNMKDIDFSTLFQGNDGIVPSNRPNKQEDTSIVTPSIQQPIENAVIENVVMDDDIDEYVKNLNQQNDTLTDDTIVDDTIVDDTIVDDTIVDDDAIADDTIVDDAIADDSNIPNSKSLNEALAVQKQITSILESANEKTLKLENDNKQLQKVLIEKDKEILSLKNKLNQQTEQIDKDIPALKNKLNQQAEQIDKMHTKIFETENMYEKKCNNLNAIIKTKESEIQKIKNDIKQTLENVINTL